MTLSRMIVGAWVLLVGLSAGAIPAQANEGLSTHFADVQIAEVLAGAPFAVVNGAEPGFVVHNLGAMPVDVEIRPLIPSESQLRGGAMPLPSLEWLRIEPAARRISPNSEGLFKMTLTVPNEAEFKGKTYQIMLWSKGRIITERGLSLAPALMSRLRFHVTK